MYLKAVIVLKVTLIVIVYKTNVTPLKKKNLRRIQCQKDVANLLYTPKTIAKSLKEYNQNLTSSHTCVIAQDIKIIKTLSSVLLLNLLLLLAYHAYNNKYMNY